MNNEIPKDLINIILNYASVKYEENNFCNICDKCLENEDIIIYYNKYNTLIQYCDYCNSEKIRKALMLTKFSGWNTKEVIKNIP